MSSKVVFLLQNLNFKYGMLNQFKDCPKTVSKQVNFTENYNKAFGSSND